MQLLIIYSVRAYVRAAAFSSSFSQRLQSFFLS
jgi:hypothetical protein